MFQKTKDSYKELLHQAVEAYEMVIFEVIDSITIGDAVKIKRVFDSGYAWVKENGKVVEEIFESLAKKNKKTCEAVEEMLSGGGFLEKAEELNKAAVAAFGEIEKLANEPEGDVYIANAFSLNMLQDPSCSIKFEKIAESDVPKDSAISAIGHADLAAIAGVACNRATLQLRKGDVLFIAQYLGPRLAEGTTELPEGARIDWFRTVIR